MKKIISLFLLLAFVFMPAGAKNLVNSRAKVNTEFNIIDESAEIFEFSPNENIRISRDVDIPPKAKIKAQIVQSQKERRWHKSGFLICKLLSFSMEGVNVDISQYDAYLIIRKYEPIDKKEAAILATELIVMTGASFFAPGVDIGYFFAKGAILRKKHPNWFKAGVMNAYENSICWFWLKGKPINLTLEDEVKLKYMEPLDARDLSAKVKYRKDKASFKKEKKVVKKEVKEIKKEYKKELKEHKKMAKLMRKTLIRQQKVEAKIKNEE